MKDPIGPAPGSSSWWLERGGSVLGVQLLFPPAPELPSGVRAWPADMGGGDLEGGTCCLGVFLGSLFSTWNRSALHAGAQNVWCKITSFIHSFIH